MGTTTHLLINIYIVKMSTYLFLSDANYMFFLGIQQQQSNEVNYMRVNKTECAFNKMCIAATYIHIYSTVYT